jgi:glycine cleavage system H lipoate-binding protein
MVPVLVLLTFAALVALDHFVLSKGYLDEKSGWPARLEVLPPLAAHERVPAGVFLQPTYTWSRVGESGAVYLGVHPTLLGIVGPCCEIELRAPGERVAMGEALVRIGRAGRRLTVRSPIAGRVERVNRHAGGEPGRRTVEGGNPPWLYLLRPESAAGAGSGWLSGEAALEWTRRRYDQLREYLQSADRAGHLGVVMADGGELPAGILGEMDEGVWAGLEDRFLSPAATTSTRHEPSSDIGGRA